MRLHSVSLHYFLKDLDMTPFLKDLAETFYAKHGVELKDFCFVTPNKRSGTFLKNYLQEAFNKSQSGEGVFILPEIVTITDFVADLSGMVVNTRIDSLFSLYKIYSAKEGAEVDFDRFRIWGEIALSDFNDVDMFCVDASKLFRNLVTLNEIATDYLTEEQREVVETYFPSGASRRESGSFWRHFNNKSDSGKKYLRLWEVLDTLYHELKEDLAKRNLCLSGGAYRRALERIEEKEIEILPYKQVVFVGFNALTTVEYRIFKAIKNIRVRLDGASQSLGDYYWDAAGEILSGDNYAAHFMKKNRKHFPSKHRLAGSCNVTGFPQTTKVIACPGNTIQTKVVAEILKEVHAKESELLKSPEGLAVAMPDENLFFPMLYSLPSELGEVNITMGYPLKVTSTYSWMRLFRTLHAHSRLEFGVPCFLRQDIIPLISHPISRVLLGSKVCQWLGSCLGGYGSFTVSALDFIRFMNCDNLSDDPKERKVRLQELSAGKHKNTDKALEMILLPLSSFKRTGQLCEHLIGIVDLIMACLTDAEDSDTSSMLKSQIEIDNLTTYADAVMRFRDAAELHGVEMSHISAFALINQLLSSERITLNGEPLSGVQIMGMLETRSLDFENVIITSMNERIFPRRLRNRSFIPNSLRQDCGMATTRFQESIFAYYFYRMISRARNVWLLYDSRSAGVRSGDPSRYIYQLRYLYPEKANLINQTRRISVVSGSAQELVGEKTPEVMQKLLRYLEKDSGHSLSASAIKKYLTCPLQFYFHYIKGVKIKEEKTEAMSPAEIGTIFHDTMKDIYASELAKGNPAVITSEIIDGWLRSENGGLSFAAQTLKDNITKKYLRVENFDGDLEGYAKIYFDPIFFYVKCTLQADRQFTPFEYIGGEDEEIVTFPLNDDKGREVNIKYIIDRIDRVDGRVRLIDYKTGGDSVETRNMAEVFSKNHAILQLLLYASLFDIRNGNNDPLKICIAKPALLEKFGFSYDIFFNGAVLDNHLDVKAEFEKKMRSLLTEIFDPDVPFTQTKSRSSTYGPCSYCDFSGICRMKKFDNMLNNTSSDNKLFQKN